MDTKTMYFHNTVPESIETFISDTFNVHSVRTAANEYICAVCCDTCGSQFGSQEVETRDGITIVIVTGEKREML